MMDQMDELVDIKHFIPQLQNIHFLIYRTYSMIDHMLGHKTSLKIKKKKPETIPHLFSQL